MLMTPLAPAESGDPRTKPFDDDWDTLDKLWYTLAQSYELIQNPCPIRAHGRLTGDNMKATASARSPEAELI